MMMMMLMNMIFLLLLLLVSERERERETADDIQSPIGDTTLLDTGLGTDNIHP